MTNWLKSVLTLDMTGSLVKRYWQEFLYLIIITIIIHIAGNIPNVITVMQNRLLSLAVYYDSDMTRYKVGIYMGGTEKHGCPSVVI